MKCVECDQWGDNPNAPEATRTDQNGVPVCERHWREAGMYDPSQGFEVTEADWVRFLEASR